MARIPYADLDAAPPNVREVFDALPVHLNIFRMLAQAQTAFRPFMRFAEALLTQLELDARLRELAILQVAQLEEAEYEWIQHAAIALAVGVSDAQVAAVKQGEIDADCFDQRERLTLRFTTEVVRDVRASDTTFEAVAAEFPPREIVELMLVIGNYAMLARVMRTLDLELDEPAGTAVINAVPARPDSPATGA